jgi:fumarate reductase subunit D
VTYIFLLVIAALFVIYYFYVIPENKFDFHDRSNRILKTLASNFQKHAQVLKNTFSEVKIQNKDSFQKQQDVYKELYENTHYDTTALKGDSSYIRIEETEEWQIHYNIDTLNLGVTVPLQPFADKLLEHRKELFDSYVLLLPAPGGSRDIPWTIVYKTPHLTNSENIYLDTTEEWQGNSDRSGIMPVTIGGNEQILFYQPFHLGDQELLIGGLVLKGKYRENIYSVPTSFIIPTAIAMILVLIVLPLFKIYFLSPNETVYRGDVLACNMSIFMGSAAILMILIFIYLFKLTSASYQNRMHDLGKQIRKELKEQLDSAGQQLKEYEKKYAALSPSERSSLKDAQTNIQLDDKFYPDKFPHLKRLLWVDSKGNTLAKWTPYDYNFPLTNVSQYDFFQELKSISKGKGDSSQLVTGSGWSNVTGEFLVFIARPLKRRASSAKESDIIGVVLATSLHLNTNPVLPPGFGYCVVNRKGDVIIHSDKSRKLSENIFVETRHEPTLLNSIRLKTAQLVKDVQLYGRGHDLVVYHVDEYPLSIVLYFERGRVIANISRFLHFTITCLLLLFISTALYVACFTYKKRSPSKLRFSLYKQQWMHPSSGNQYSFSFTIRYFLWLFVFNFLLFIILQCAGRDLRSLLFLSLVLPLYTLLGIVIGRKSLTRNPAEGSFWKTRQFARIAIANFLILSVFNSFFIVSICKDPGGSFWPNLALLIGAQLLYLILIYILHSRVEVQWANGNDIIPPGEAGTGLLNIYYRYSIYGAVLLITVLPTFGITSYGYFAERIQHKKEKELAIATAYETKYNYLQNELRSSYKNNLLGKDSQHRPNSYLRTKGNYLSDHDTILFTRPANHPGQGPGLDGPYLSVSSELDYYTGSLLGRQALDNWSCDSGKTWQFVSYDGSLILRYRGRSRDMDTVWVRSSYEAPLSNFGNVFLPGGLVFLGIVCLFLYGCFFVIKTTLQRLFLLHFANPVNVQANYLERLFNSVPRLPNDSIIDSPNVLRWNETLWVNSGTPVQSEGYILQMTHYMKPVYENIWKDQSETEQFLLYDLARDGYTNYKNPEVIHALLNKGVLKYENYKLDFFSYSFRNFVIIKGSDPKLQANFKRYSVGGVWHSLRAPVLLIITALGVFFLMTQQKIAQDLTTVITSLLALIPLLTQLLGTGTSAASPEDEKDTAKKAG